MFISGMCNLRHRMEKRMNTMRVHVKAICKISGFAALLMLASSCSEKEKSPVPGPSAVYPAVSSGLPSTSVFPEEDPVWSDAVVWTDPAGDCPKAPDSNLPSPLDVIKVSAVIKDAKLHVKVQFAGPIMDYWGKPLASGEWRTGDFMILYLDMDGQPSTGSFLSKEVGPGFEVAMMLKLGARYTWKDSNQVWEGNLVADPKRVGQILSPTCYANVTWGSWEKASKEESTENWGLYEEFSKADADWIEFHWPVDKLGILGIPRLFFEESHQAGAGKGRDALSEVKTLPRD